MRPLIYLTVLSGNFLYRPQRARVVPREFLLRDKTLMLERQPPKTRGNEGIFHN